MSAKVFESRMASITKSYQKYELSDCRVVIHGVEMRRIIAAKSIPSLGIKVGDTGGFVQSELNLSQSGTCWIHKNSLVAGSAIVSGDSYIDEGCLIYAGKVTGLSELKNVTIRNGDPHIVISNCSIKSDTFITISLGKYENSEISEEPIQIRMVPFNINTCGEKIFIADQLMTKDMWLEEIYKFAMENKMNDILYKRYAALLSSL